MAPWVRRPGRRTSPARSAGSDAAWLIVGLGNPGPEYVRSPHNIGFAAIEELAARNRVPLIAKHKGLYGTGTIGETGVAVLQPLTFMNLSGESVRPAQKQLGLDAANVLVVHDELDLPFGALRVKQGGGLAGHNGLKSINQYLKSPEFVRLRVGIGRPEPGDRRPVRDWILKPMGPEIAYEDLAQRAAQAIEQIVTEGVTPAMNAINTSRP
jgi:PTH1 family peptidyl-tRNA hydrolase